MRCPSCPSCGPFGASWVDVSRSVGLEMVERKGKGGYGRACLDQIALPFFLHGGEEERHVADVALVLRG